MNGEGFFVEPTESEPDDRFEEGLDEIPFDIHRLTDAEVLMQAAPDYYGPKFQAIAELRAMDDGTLHRGNEFRRVASLVNIPIAQAIRMTEPGFFRDKRTFYRWLAKHPEYKTYDSRGGSRPSSTVVDGKEIV